MSEHDSDLGNFLAGFVLGGLIGAAVALLLAPQPGEETRTLIRERSIELKDKAAGTAEEARTRAEKALVDARQRADSALEEARVRAEEVAKLSREKVSELQTKGQQVLEESKTRFKVKKVEPPAEEPPAESGAEASG